MRAMAFSMSRTGRAVKGGVSEWSVGTTRERVTVETRYYSISWLFHRCEHARRAAGARPRKVALPRSRLRLTRCYEADKQRGELRKSEATWEGEQALVGTLAVYALSLECGVSWFLPLARRLPLPCPPVGTRLWNKQRRKAGCNT